MCDSCGCDPKSEPVTIRKPGSNTHDHLGSRTVKVGQDVLALNKDISDKNREYFKSRNILALNLVSSPGSGKTTILEKTILGLKDRLQMSVIEGDQQTTRDADRIKATGAEVVQVNTGSGCHLDGAMVAKAIDQLDLKEGSVLFIENVGNLVCPAMFDLGEAAKVVMISVTEGEDKPEKYPHMFNAAEICLINKIDLLPHLDFNNEVCRSLAKQVNPNLEFIEISAVTEEGMDAWFDWVLQKRAG